MTGVTQTSSALLGPVGHWRNWVGNQSFIARHIAGSTGLKRRRPQDLRRWFRSGPHATKLAPRASPALREGSSHYLTLISVMTYAFARVGVRSAPGPHATAPEFEILAYQ